jgi:riboflavin synthase
VFSGIVQEVGRVEALERGDALARLGVLAPETAASTRTGDSVAVHGVCLTAIDVRDGAIWFDAVPETLARSSLGRLGEGAAVNVERALRAGEPLGGHLVQGHVDGVGAVRAVDPEGEGVRATIAAPPELLRYCAEKGSIAVDGVSLTVTTVESDAFTVALVPHTLGATTLGTLRPGDEVNLEADVVAKYVERLLESRAE